MSPCPRAIAVAVLSVAAFTAPGAYAGSEQSKPDACAQTVNAMGALMSRDEAAGPEGAAAVRYVVRTNGIDYDVVCEAATGVVTDVTRRDPGAGDGTH